MNTYHEGRKTAKAYGFKKGDLVWTGVFPGVVIGDVHTKSPLCEVYGFEHESGSVYSDDLRHLSAAEFMMNMMAHGYSQPFEAYSKVAADGMRAAGLEVRP